MILWALINRNSESNNKEIFYLTKQSPGYKAGSPHYISPVLFSLTLKSHYETNRGLSER